MAAIATTTATAQVWTPLIEAQAKAMEEYLTDKGIEVTEEMRSDIVSVLEQQTDDHVSLFKKKAGRKSGSKTTTKKTTGKQCCANTYGNGTPKRCTRGCGEDEGDYCSMHSKECAKYGGSPKHGRFDEETPLTWKKFDKGLQISKGIHEWKSDKLVARMKEAGLYKEKASRGRKASTTTKAPKKKASKRAPSAYNLFMKDPEQRAKAEGETAPEKMKGLSKIWKEMSDEEKRPYEEESSRLKEELKEKLRDESEEAEASEAASVATETESVSEVKETPEPEVKSAEEETDPDDMSGDVGDLLEDEEDEPEIDVDAFPTITHKMMKTTVHYDADTGMLYDNESKALLGPISGMGGKDAFDMSNVL